MRLPAIQIPSLGGCIVLRLCDIVVPHALVYVVLIALCELVILTDERIMKKDTQVEKSQRFFSPPPIPDLSP